MPGCRGASSGGRGGGGTVGDRIRGLGVSGSRAGGGGGWGPGGPIAYWGRGWQHGTRDHTVYIIYIWYLFPARPINQNKLKQRERPPRVNRPVCWKKVFWKTGPKKGRVSRRWAPRDNQTSRAPHQCEKKRKKQKTTPGSS